MTEQRDRVQAIVNDILTKPTTGRRSILLPTAIGVICGCVLTLFAAGFLYSTNDRHLLLNPVTVEALIAYTAEQAGVPRRRLRAELTKEMGGVPIHDLEPREMHTAVCKLIRRLGSIDPEQVRSVVPAQSAEC